MHEEKILKWFSYEHLPADKQKVSKVFADAAAALLVLIPQPGEERTVALRKLLEGKDAAVRAAFEVQS